MGGKLFLQPSEPFVGLMDAPLQPPCPQIAHSAGADFLPFPCAGCHINLCMAAVSLQGQKLHRGDRAKQFACIYLSLRG